MNADILARCTRYLEDNDVSVNQAIRNHAGTEMNKYYFSAASKKMKRDGSKYTGRNKVVKPDYRGLSLPFSEFGKLVKGD